MTGLRSESEALWRRAVAALRRRDQWPEAADLSTPAEAAALLEVWCGDARLLAFVEGFYYPQRYGEQTGAMSLEEATWLVANLERNAAVEVARQPDSGAEVKPASQLRPQPVNCGLCGRDTRGKSGGSP